MQWYPCSGRSESEHSRSSLSYYRYIALLLLLVASTACTPPERDTEAPKQAHEGQPSQTVDSIQMPINKADGIFNPRDFVEGMYYFYPQLEMDFNKEFLMFLDYSSFQHQQTGFIVKSNDSTSKDWQANYTHVSFIRRFLNPDYKGYEAFTFPISDRDYYFLNKAIDSVFSNRSDCIPDRNIVDGEHLSVLRSHNGKVEFFHILYGEDWYDEDCFEADSALYSIYQKVSLASQMPDSTLEFLLQYQPVMP